MARGRHSQRGSGRGWVIVVCAVAAAVALGGGTAYAAYRYDRVAASRILPGVSIDDVDVGGMTRDEAIRAVTAQADGRLGETLRISAAGFSWTVDPAGLGTRADIEGAVGTAFGVADGMSLFSRVYHRVAGEPVPTSIALGYTFDEAAIRSFVQRAADEVDRPPVNAAIRLVEGELVVRRAKTGEALRAEAAVQRIRMALGRQLDEVSILVKTIQPEVTGATLGKTIVVDLSENQLYLYDGLKVVRQYPVATAAPGYTTPVGTWTVERKAENPTWYNPAPDTWGAGEPLVIPPGPGNPLGTRALYLSAPGIRIHGTYNYSSIGTYASHGCIRMLISDSEELYPLVLVGTTAIIKP